MPSNSFESKDKQIRDIKEGPPRGVESKEKLERSVRIETTESSGKKASLKRVKPEMAHKIGLALLRKKAAVEKLKALLAEKIVRGEHVSRLDVAVAKQELQKDPYGTTKEHIATVGEGSFLTFDVARDGDDLAMTFAKRTGDSALRPIDNAVLADMLNQIFRMHPAWWPKGLEEQEALVQH